MPDLTVNGIKMHYEEQGSGDPLVFIMGLGANHLAWVPVLPLFSDKYRCITFDNRGVGLSDVPDGPYSIEQLADDAAGLMDALGIASAPVIGLSMGGSILQALLYRHPEKVTKGVLLSTLPSYTEIQHKWLDANIALRKVVDDPLVLGVSGMPWAFTPAVLADHFKAIEYAKLGAQNPYPTTVKGFELQAEAIRKYDSRPHLPTVKAPVLVVVGAEDVLTPPHQAVEMAELIPTAHLEIIPRGGHVGVLEFTADYARAIRGFLEK